MLKRGPLPRFLRKAQAIVGLILVVAGVGIAQTPAQPAFEVVSIRPNTSSEERTSSIVMPGAIYRATNVTLRMLIKTAYQVHDVQIVGGPGRWAWLDEHGAVRCLRERDGQSDHYGIRHPGTPDVAAGPCGSVSGVNQT